MISVAVALALGAVAAQPDYREIDHAIEARRLTQARQMLAVGIEAGATGPQVERRLAALAFASGLWQEAAARYQVVLAADGRDAESLQNAAVANLMIADERSALGLAERAVAAAPDAWRAWNILGVVHDRSRNWDQADEAFEKALRLQPDEPKVLNNHGWSLLVRGEWQRANALLEKAAALDGKSTRIRNNLELSRAALAADLPIRTPGETDDAFAARLNDAGVLAQGAGDTKRAIAAFARALSVRQVWYAKAANNLERVQH